MGNDLIYEISNLTLMYNVFVCEMYQTNEFKIRCIKWSWRSFNLRTSTFSIIQLFLCFLYMTQVIYLTSYWLSGFLHLHEIVSVCPALFKFQPNGCTNLDAVFTKLNGCLPHWLGPYWYWWPWVKGQGHNDSISIFSS